MLVSNNSAPAAMESTQRGRAKSRKILWIDYVKRFVEENEDIPEELFGRWINILVDEKKANR